MKFTGKIESITLSRETRKPLVTITMDRDSPEIDDLMEKELSIEIKPYHPPRSLSANAYAWLLISRLAAKLNETSETIYRQTIQNLGGVSEVVRCRTKAVPGLTKAWTAHGLGWIVKPIDDKDGWTNCMLYYGSSTYDTEQMTRFIDLLVQECKEQGIDTMSERERSLLK